MKKWFSFMMVVALSANTFLYAADSGGEQAPVQPKKTISVDFQDTPLSTVLDVLSVKTGRKLITDSELAKKRIVFSLRDVSAEEALNALLDTYSLYYVRQPNTNIYVIKSKGDVKEPPTLVSKIITLNYASANDLAVTLKTNLGKNGFISVDARTNSIIVTDIADSIDKVDTMLKVLDTPTLQVVLEARIIDGSISNDLSWGMTLQSLYRDNLYYRNPLDVYNAGGATASILAKPQVAYTQAYQGTGNNQLAVRVLQNGYNIEGLITAEAVSNNAKVLSNPKLLVLNNQEATIDIVEQVPYASQVTAGSPPVISFSFKEVGIRLRVRPQINKDGSIVLIVAPEQSFRAGSVNSGGVVLPIINTSRATTTMMVQNGDTAVIGGLIRESDSVSETKVPLLGDIPIIGYLFKSYTKSKVRKELTIFITARIVE